MFWRNNAFDFNHQNLKDMNKPPEAVYGCGEANVSVSVANYDDDAILRIANETFQYPMGLLVKELNQIGDPLVFYYRQGSATSHIMPGILTAEYFDDVRLLHITGIFPTLSASCLETVFSAIAIAKSKGMLVSFDPNIRLQLWSEQVAQKTLLEIAQKTDLILPGIADKNF